MKLAELVVDSDTGEPDTQRFYRSGDGRNTRVSNNKTFWLWGSDSSMSVRLGRPASFTISVTVHDVKYRADLMVTVDGSGFIDKHNAKRAAESHAMLGDLEAAAVHFLRKALDQISTEQASKNLSLADIAFAKEEGARATGAQAMLEDAFRQIGVSLKSLRLLPKFGDGQRFAEAELKRPVCGPRQVMVLGRSEPVTVRFGIVLRLDPENLGAAMKAVSADAALDEAEERIWSALAGAYDVSTFRTGLAKLEADLARDINREIQPRYGRTLSYLRFDTSLRIAPVGIDPRRQLRHDMMYKIRGTARDLPLSHEIGWFLPETDGEKAAYEAGGQYDGFIKKVKTEMDQVTQIYLQEKTFADIIFDFYADQNTTQTELGGRVRQRLIPIARQYGVELEGSVTTTLGEIPEAVLFKGGDIKVLPPEGHDYPLKEAGVGVRVSITVPILLDRKKNDEVKKRLADLLDSSATEGVDRGLLPFAYKIDREVRVAVARALAVTDAKQFLQSTLCERQDTDLVERIQKEVAAVLVGRFGLKLEAEDVQVGAEPCAFVELSSGVLGKVREVEAECEPALYDRGAEYAASQVKPVTITVPYRVNGIGFREHVRADLDPETRQLFQTEFFHRYVQTISANRDVERVLEQVDNIVKSLTRVFIAKQPHDILQPELIDESGILDALSWLIERRVIEETGLDIKVAADRIEVDFGGERFASLTQISNQQSRQKLLVDYNKVKDEIALYGAEPELVDRKKRLEDRLKELEDDMTAERNASRPDGEHRRLLITAARSATESTFKAYNIPRLTGPSAAE